MLLCLAFVGCQLAPKQTELPGEQQVTRDQLVVYSNFHLPRKHRLLDELSARREDISKTLLISPSDEPINVFLFEDDRRFRRFIEQRYPKFPDRRALFVKSDTSLNVYAYWGDRVAEDLRHEVSHGYMHSVVPNLPLWLDEGVAEYFEVSRGKGGLNRPHVYLLSNELRRNSWTPNMKHLENLTVAEQMSQLEYAESWLWIHFLLEFSPESRNLLQTHFQQLIDDGNAPHLWPKVYSLIPNANEVLMLHLKKLAATLN